MDEKVYRIIKKETDRFTADIDGKSVVCFSRKKNKKDEILVGDFVFLNGDIIEDVKIRKNRLIRPAIANIDQVIFVVCSVPKPDFFLLDKAIVNCLKNNIDIIICINKSDINSPCFDKDILQQYVGRKIIAVSATDGIIDGLLKLLDGKMSCLAGQSAVGKSTIINALFGENTAKIGDLSAINRGKNTTTSSRLYKVQNGFLADTPGFSMLDIFDIDYRELNLYYPEFIKYSDSCKFNACTHTTEPDCTVKAKVSQGEINKKRYDRYHELFIKLKTQKLNEFK